MKKPPKRLVIKPGRYRTRDGRIADVLRGRDHAFFKWSGMLDGNGECWTAHGEWLRDAKDKADLVKRLPDETPKPAKRERLQWGLWVPTGNEHRAKLVQETVHRYWNFNTQVRRLPVLPATRKEK